MARSFVIVGASLAGASAALTLRDEGFDGRIVLLGAEPDLPYERPPLSKTYLRGTTPFEKALVRPANEYADRRIDLRLGTVVRRIDVAARQVHVDGGAPEDYDALLVATGGRNRRPPIPGLDLRGVHGLRIRADADRIRAEIAPGRHAVVVGLGFIGSEVAASLRLAGLDVTAIEPGPAPLVRVLGEQVGAEIARLHEAHGVQTIFGDTVVRIEGDERVQAVVTEEGARIACDFVVLGVGIEPVVDVVSGTGVKVENGILVDECCRTNVSGIFAAGDVANHFHPVFGHHMRVEHWQNALKQGAAAARSMLGQARPYDEIHWFWSDQYDVNVQYAGHHRSWEQLVVRGSLEAHSAVAFFVTRGRIDAAVALNRGRELRGAIPLIRSRAAVDLDRLADPAVPLADVAVPR